MTNTLLFRLASKPEENDYAELKDKLKRKLEIETQCYEKGAYSESVDNVALDIAVGIIKHFEGFSSTVYKCPAGIPTIGYGRTMLTPEELKGKPTTEEAETLWMYKHIKKNILPVIHKKELHLGYRFNCCLRASLLSFCYNLGNTAITKETNGIYRALKAGSNTKEKVEGISHELKKWIYSQGRRLSGLEKRRKLESVCATISLNVYPIQ